MSNPSIPEGSLARPSHGFGWPPSDPLGETERFRAMREALGEAATPPDRASRRQRRAELRGWRRWMGSWGRRPRRGGDRPA